MLVPKCSCVVSEGTILEETLGKDTSICSVLANIQCPEQDQVQRLLLDQKKTKLRPLRARFCKKVVDHCPHK